MGNGSNSPFKKLGNSAKELINSSYKNVRKVGFANPSETKIVENVEGEQLQSARSRL